MRLDMAFTEFAYSKDWTPASRAWYSSRLGAFTKWCSQQDITDIEDITTSLARRYLDYRRTAPAKSGKPLDSHTLHGHARAVRAFLNWAAREEVLRESAVKRSGMPKRKQKVTPTLSQQQIDRLFAACDQGETPEYVARDRAILALLLDTGMRAGELCTLSLDNVYFAPDDAHCLVYGKGRRQSEVGLGKKSRQLLHRYVYRYRQAPKEMQRVFVAKGTSRSLLKDSTDSSIGYETEPDSKAQGYPLMCSGTPTPYATWSRAVMSLSSPGSWDVRASPPPKAICARSPRRLRDRERVYSTT